MPSTRGTRKGVLVQVQSTAPKFAGANFTRAEAVGASAPKRDVMARLASTWTCAKLRRLRWLPLAHPKGALVFLLGSSSFTTDDQMGCRVQNRIMLRMGPFSFTSMHEALPLDVFQFLRRQSRRRWRST
jgi:hypothetical protein